jgi:CHAT domain
VGTGRDDVRAAIEALDNFEVVRFFSHFAKGVFDGIREAGIAVLDEILAELKSEASMNSLMRLDQQKKQMVLEPEQAAYCSRTILLNLAEHPSFRQVLKESLDSYSDQEMVADLSLHLGFAASMVEVAATTTLDLSFEDGKLKVCLGEKVASAKMIKAPVEAMANAVRDCSLPRTDSENKRVEDERLRGAEESARLDRELAERVDRERADAAADQRRIERDRIKADGAVFDDLDLEIGPAAPAASQATSAREVIVTAHTLDGHTVRQFETGRDYHLKFRVGKFDPHNLASGDLTITAVPSGGLQTHWVVSTTDVQLATVSASAIVRKVGQTWTAEFDIFIPETGESPTESIGIKMNSLPASLSVLIYGTFASGAQEFHRDLLVKLEAAPVISRDELCKSPDQLNLHTPHEWATPPAHIQIVIVNGIAVVSSQQLAAKQYRFIETFTAWPTTLAGSILNVRNSLETLRENHSDYLDDLDAADMAQRLTSGNWRLYAGSLGWTPPDEADPKHEAAFRTAQNSGEFQALASDGYSLFDACFAAGTQLRSLLEELPPGSRIDFMWNAQGGAGLISHVPWALMYTKPVDVTGSSTPDPLNFLGLRFRIGSFSWPVSNASVAIGGLDSTWSLWLMYWGDKDGDEVAREAQWQAAQFKTWTQLKFLPAAATDRKREVVLALDQPQPAPAGILYMYCHCSVGTGAEPCLRFGNTSRDEDILRRVDLSQKALKDAPLVFANACTTAQADPHMSSELEQRFFNRGIRAFIGTETKIPVVLASRFAWLFFQFLYRRADPEPLCAGEALTQTRMFLWTQYRNLGGLFYSITNQYDLYLASSQEVASIAQK